MDETREAIATIEALYPIDSGYPKTNEIGMRLLMQALERYDWRKLPADLLQSYADLCIAEEARQSYAILHKYDTAA